MVLSRSSSTTYLRLCILSALGVFALSSNAAITDDAIASNNTLPEVELDKIVVTATRTPTKISNTIAQARVIDSEELQRSQGQSALDVIKRQPGISHYSNGGLGTVSNIYMRGYDGKQILVLIDGVRYSSMSSGTAALNLLPADQIDRIEILYGASGSSIYGADAMGGVIQVFTKGANVEQSNFSVTAGVGSNDHYTYGASAQFANEKGTSLSLSASHNETKGFNATLPSASDYYRDDDGFKATNASLALQHNFSDAISAGVSALYSDSTTDIDSAKSAFPDAYSDQKNGSANSFIQYQTPLTISKLSYGQSVDKSTSHNAYSIDYKDGSKFDTTQQHARLETKINTQPGIAIIGAEWLSQKLEASDVIDWSSGAPLQTAYTPDDRTVKSAFAGYQLAGTSYDLQANLRFDDNSQFGNQTTYNLGGAYYITPDIRAGASYAKGFRAPTFNELYYPGGSGNPDLNPETSDNYEVFIGYDTALQSTRLTGYHNKVYDWISYSDDTNLNIDEAKIKGVTLTSDWIVNNYLFGGSYDYQKAKDNSDYTGRVDYKNDAIDYNGNYLSIRPENKGIFYVGYRLPSLDVRAEYEYVGHYYSNVENAASQFVDNYGLFNISGNYKLTDSLFMTARLNNIANKKYITLPGYNTDGTNFFTSLTYNWF